MTPWLRPPIAVKVDDEGRLVSDSPMPPELVLLRHSSETQLHRGGRGAAGTVKIFPAVVFTHARRVLVGVQMSLELVNGQLYFAPDDREALATRWAQLAVASDAEPVDRPYGVMGLASRPLMGGDHSAALGWSQIYWDEAGQAFLGDGAPGHPVSEWPSAILFWDTQLPSTLSVKIEPTTKCNFKCSFCYGRKVKQGTVRPERLQEFIDAFPDLEQLELIGEGEALLLPSLPAIIRSATDRGVHVSLASNGSLLTPRLSRKLIDSGVREIGFSLETLDPKRFNELRPAGDLSAILQAIHHLAELRSQLRPALRLKLWMTVLRESVDQIEDVEALAARLGLDGVEYQTLNPMPRYARNYDAGLRENMLSPEDLHRLARDAPERGGAVLTDLASPRQGTQCTLPSEMVRIGWQGHVTPCCFLQSPLFEPFGDLTQEAFDQIADTERYRVFRFATLHGVALASCELCPLIDSVG